MRQPCLIDLYVHSSSGSVEEIVDVASNEGLDAVCFVVDSIDELPEADVMNRASERGRAVIYPGLSVNSGGTRWLILVPGWSDAPMEVFETLDDAQLLADAVAELGGVMIPICPHQLMKHLYHLQQLKLPLLQEQGLSRVLFPHQLQLQRLLYLLTLNLYS